MFIRSIKVALILVYLVIIAGAMVRMTGSGMGCPDWPKCFGYYIPPTEIQQLEWQPNQSYKKGQVIIKDSTLKVAHKNFTSTQIYSATNWKMYTKHDYAIFNVWHTWIEYINRLIGALSGLAVLIMAVCSLWHWHRKKLLVLLSFISVFLLGFQAWLGAKVVYSVLAPVKITLHMVMALVIVGVLIFLLNAARQTKKLLVTRPFLFTIGLVVIATLWQIVLGTQVREWVDAQIELVGYTQKAEWLATPDLSFYIHRTFSILLIGTHILVWYWARKTKITLPLLNFAIGLVLMETLLGISMYYFNFPVLTQPLHLVFATLLIGIQVNWLTQLTARKQVT